MPARPGRNLLSSSGQLEPLIACALIWFAEEFPYEHVDLIIPGLMLEKHRGGDHHILCNFIDETTGDAAGAVPEN